MTDMTEECYDIPLYGCISIKFIWRRNNIMFINNSLIIIITCLGIISRSGR